MYCIHIIIYDNTNVWVYTIISFDVDSSKCDEIELCEHLLNLQKCQYNRKKEAKFDTLMGTTFEVRRAELTDQNDTEKIAFMLKQNPWLCQEPSLVGKVVFK